MMNDVQSLLEARYYAPGESTWGELVQRVVDFVCYGKTWRNRAHAAILDREFLPGSPILMNAGRKVPMLHSCFVLPIEDSIESIMRTLSETVFIEKYGGGVGINFSAIRADGSPISSTGGKASGPVSFLGLWNAAMDAVKQAGKRQGALMGVLNVDHPDLLKFIHAKTEEGKLTNFNISVGFTREFAGAEGSHPFPCGKTKAELMEIISKSIWRNGEPGILFLDNINDNNPYDVPIISTNPCGEIPIPPYGVCCLGSINLNACLTKEWEFDWGKFKKLIGIGIRFLDATLDRADFILPTTTAFAHQWRPLGLGVMGLADILAKMGMEYGGEECLSFLRSLFSFMRGEARQVARHLLKEENRLRRNTTLLAIAPTGTIAMIAGCSYSIEPYFKLAYTKVVDSGEFRVIEPALLEIGDRRGYLPIFQENLSWILDTGSIQSDGIDPKFSKLFLTASEISWQKHIIVQATIQKYVDNAVSKTINMPNWAGWENVQQAICMAWYEGCKGLTIYRESSRETEVFQNYNCPTGRCEL